MWSQGFQPIQRPLEDQWHGTTNKIIHIFNHLIDISRAELSDAPW